jgi:SAM-dependent methyltransferase
MARSWTADDVLAVARSFQPACVLTAAADLDVFTVLADGPRDARQVAQRVQGQVRGTTILLDALVALELLHKQGEQYALAPAVDDLLVEGRPGNVLPMLRHQGNCLRRWAQLARVVREGGPAKTEPSIRGAAEDTASFIGAMQNVSGPIADAVVRDLPPLDYRHLLDVGGASGTWTLAFLRANPGASATLFDLPAVIPMAQKRMEAEGLAARVRLVAGDFMRDPLPEGADLAWVSAIVHQNSREENRRLFASIARALPAGGQVLIRDIVMDDSHTAPASGALFAVNMLVATEGGGTFSVAELREDLEAAGFSEVEIIRRDEGMSSVVRARKR